MVTGLYQDMQIKVTVVNGLYQVTQVKVTIIMVKGPYQDRQIKETMVTDLYQNILTHIACFIGPTVGQQYRHWLTVANINPTTLAIKE